MANNTLLTVDMITNESLRVLHQKCNFIGSTNRQYDEAFGKSGSKIGDTLRVRKPVQYVVRNGITMSAQDTVEEKVDLPMSTVMGVDMEFGSQELALKLDDFSDRIIKPAMSVLAANIESAYFQAMYKKVYNIVDNDGAALSFLNLQTARQRLTENLAPNDDRYAILSPEHTTKAIDALKGLFHDASAVEKQYREGIMGRTGGMTFMENTLVGKHTTGTAVKSTGYLVNGAAQTGASLTVDTGTTTFLEGDIITIANVFRVHPETKVSTGALQQFVVTANSGGSATSLAISPAITVTGARQNVSASPADNAAITKVGAAASETLDCSLAYHKDAFTFVTGDLPLPDGVDFAARKVLDGISMSIVRDFSISDRTFPCRVDVLFGYAALRPEMACRIHADA